MDKIDTSALIESWGWRLKKSRIRQKDFAESIGISDSQLSLYLNKKMTPQLSTFEAIENKLKEYGV